MTIKTNWSCKDTVFPLYSCSHIIFIIDSVWLSRREGTLLRRRPVSRREWPYARISSPTLRPSALYGVIKIVFLRNTFLWCKTHSLDNDLKEVIFQ